MQYWLPILVKYRQVSYAKLRYSTGLMLAVNIIQILAINRNRNLIDSWHSTVLPLTQCWLLLLVKYRQMSYAKLRYSTGLMLAVNIIQILSINRNRNLIDSWHTTGLLRAQYWLLLLVKYRQVSYAKLRYSTGLMLGVNIIQILAINRHRNIIDSWHTTGLLRAQYWLLLLVK